MSVPARASSRPLASGSVVAGRFQVQAHFAAEGGTDVYQAIDATTGAPVTLRLITPTTSARAILEGDLAKAAQVEHKNLATLIAHGRDGELVFVASEALEGHTLRQLIDARRGEGQPVGATHALTLLGHVAQALEAAHKVLPHGGVNPDVVWITKQGRVKVADLGLVRALPALARRGGPSDFAYVAPEVARGGALTAVADVYSLGAVLYELLTGRPPDATAQRPSQVAPGVSPALDAVVAKAVAPQPQARFQTPSELIGALNAAATAGPIPGSPATRAAAGKTFNPADAARLTEDHERWLVQKEGLDYGPYSQSHLMAQIERGIFGGDHLIVDIDSGARVKLKDHPQLGDFVRHAHRKLESVRRAQAEQVQEKVEKKKSRATVLIVGAVVAALGAGMFIYLTNRKAAKQVELATRESDAEVDAFIKQFKLDAPNKRRATARRGGGGSDEFSSATNLGDVSGSGGDNILSDRVIQSTMMGNYRKLVPCIMSARRSDPRLTDVEIEFVVRGSGKVTAVRVNGQQRGDLPACVLAKMQTFGFPSYDGNKTVASWSMSMR